VDDLEFREPTLEEEFAGRMDAADRAARAEDQASQAGPYAFLSEHSRADADGTLATTCRTDGEAWPCTVARAFFAGRSSGYVTAAGRLDEEADAFGDHPGSAARRVAARLRVDAEELDEELSRHG
jgi:hypothetical protein